MTIRKQHYAFNFRNPGEDSSITDWGVLFAENKRKYKPKNKAKSKDLSDIISKPKSVDLSDIISIVLNNFQENFSFDFKAKGYDISIKRNSVKNVG